MSTYSNQLQPALQNLLQCVVRFFHPRSSCTTTHISADVQRITLNASCMTISGERTEQLDIFCHVTGFACEWFSQFHWRGTYSVLSQSPSNRCDEKVYYLLFLHCWLATQELVSRLVINGTFSTNRQHRTIGVWNVSRRTRGLHKHIIKQ